MSTVEISKLFSSTRLIGGTFAGIFLLIYIPLGILLIMCRLVIGLHVFLLSCLLPKTTYLSRVVLRILCLLLGIVISHEGLELADKKAKVIVANHISVFDHVAIGLVVPSIVPNVWGLPAAVTWALGYTEMGAREGRATFLRNLKSHCNKSNVPITSLPEGSMTNGQVGLLKFSTWPFDLGETVQPIALTARRPILPISIETLGSSLWKDIFWFLFVPYTHFHLRLLPSQKKLESENVEEYAARVQSLIARALGTEVTPFTSADKAEYLKKSNHYQQHEGRSVSLTQQTSSTSRLQSNTSQVATPVTAPPLGAASSSRDNDRLRTMVKQVLEVLPDTPEIAVRRDLEKSRCVDTTITNILEGQVPLYNSPKRLDQREVGGAAALKPITPSPSSVKFSAASFNKSSKDRQMSYRERKEALYQNARRYYMEKHSLIE